MRSGPTITVQWQFYYVTCLDLRITASDNFITLLYRLMKGLKNRFSGFPEGQQGNCFGGGFLSYPFHLSIHFQDANSVVLCFGGGVFPPPLSQAFYFLKPHSCELAVGKHFFLKEIK